MVLVPAAWGDWRMFAATSKRQGTWGGEMEMKRRWGRAWQAAEGEESGCGAELEDGDWGRELSNKASRQTEGSSRHQPTCQGGKRPLQGRLPAVKVWFFLPRRRLMKIRGQWHNTITAQSVRAVWWAAARRSGKHRQKTRLQREMCDYFFFSIKFKNFVSGFQYFWESGLMWVSLDCEGIWSHEINK